MCLVVLAVRPNPALSLVVAANRDELHARPSRELAEWPERPGIVAGLDLEKGGTWLGVTRSGRFAALTNVRDPAVRKTGRSRGEIVRSFLESDAPASRWCRELASRASEFPAFNLVVSDGADTRYTNEANEGGAPLGAGLHGLSNARLDVPWPKVVAARAALERALSSGKSVDTEVVFAALRRDDRAPDAALPATGVPLELERVLSAAFIRTPVYGTRCSTVVVRTADGGGFIEERRFDAAGEETGRSRLELGL
jgi:uncharacterized protein with NRDE domain